MRSNCSFRLENWVSPKAKPGIVAQRAQIAQMIGDAFALQRQRAQRKATRAAAARSVIDSSAAQ